MPALPVLSDPEAFRTLLEARTGTTTIESSKGGLIRGKHQTALYNNNNNNNNERDSCPRAGFNEKFIKPEFSEHFRDLAFIGDHKLDIICTRIVMSIWGQSNRKLVKRILDDWLSNDNWLCLAIVYRLDHLVGTDKFIPETSSAARIIFDVGKSLVGNRRKGKEGYASLKSLADLWEAYFAGLIEERELWMEATLNDDIERFFRRLLVKKYRKLIPLAMDYDIENTRVSSSTDQGDGGMWMRTTECRSKIVLRSDELLESVFGKTPLDGGETSDYGRLVTLSGKSGISSSRFAIDEEQAKSELLYGCWEGWKSHV